MAYHLDFTDKAKEDFAFHKKTGNRPILNKLLSLLEELAEHPFYGTGKPEALKYSLTALWSRRINREHRLVYEVTDTIVYIHSAMGNDD
jgi:toxin YoeB